MGAYVPNDPVARADLGRNAPSPPSTRARNASTPPRIDTITSPVRPAWIAPVEVIRPRQPTGDEPADIWRAER
jgi:hypothetical protein